VSGGEQRHDEVDHLQLCHQKTCLDAVQVSGVLPQWILCANLVKCQLGLRSGMFHSTKIEQLSQQHILQCGQIQR